MICGIYFASCAKQQKHSSALHAISRTPVIKIRPKRVISRGAHELLCCVNDELEWLDEQDVETPDENLPITLKDLNINCPIITIEKAQECPWSE